MSPPPSFQVPEASVPSADPVDPILDRLERLMEEWARLMPRLLRGAGEGVNLDLTAHQFLLLRHLECAGPTHLSSLRKHLAGAQSTTSEMVGRLVKMGYVDKSPDPADNRAVVVSATDRGREVIDARRQHMRAKHRQILEALGGGDRGRFLNAMETLVELMGKGLAGVPTGGEDE